MSEHVLKTIEMVRGQIADLEAQVAEQKRMVNSLCTLIGVPSQYIDVQVNAPTACGAARRDEFYRQPLATVARAILERRRAVNLGAASIDVLFAAMVDGGFEFTGTSDANSKRALAIALSKNTQTFHRLPNGDYGLADWYGAAPRPRGPRIVGATPDGKPADPRPASETEADAVEQEEAAVSAKPR